MIVRQRGVHFFISAPDSFIIDKIGFLELIKGAMNIDFISSNELEGLISEDYENKENNNSINIG
jgi:hypothetical protein